MPDWVLGGGTALMLHAAHRYSRDIDAFIDDPQYLSLLSPRLGGEGVWSCDAYEEASNHLRLVYPEGEIDIIVAPSITLLSAEPRSIDLEDGESRFSRAINIEHPVEIAIKKLNYRGSMLKVRDIFDVVVVDTIASDTFRKNLHRVAHVKPAIVERVSSVPAGFFQQQLRELAISDAWRAAADSCLERMKAIAQEIP